MEKVEWGEYNYSHFFDLVSPDKLLTKRLLTDTGKYPTFSSDSTNNGIIGYSDIEPSFYCDDNCPIFVVFGDHTRTFNIAQHSFNVMDNVKVLKPNQKYSLAILLFLTTSWKKGITNLGYARHWKLAKDSAILLPIINNQIDFDFIESFVAELEAERIAELEAYLKINGLENYLLSSKELDTLYTFDSLDWKEFQIEELFQVKTYKKHAVRMKKIHVTIF